MADERIILAGVWAALMFTYLLGDVLRIFAGDFTPGEMDGRPATPWMWIAAALTLPFPAIRWVALVASAFLVLFNLAGLPYPGAYDNFLIGVGFVFNGLIIWYAWGWQAA